MAGEKIRPLTPEEAKVRLLEAAGGVGPLDFTRRHPWEGVAAAFLLGCFAGSETGARGAVRESLGLLLRIL